MNLKPIVFIDTEIEPKSGKILDIGGVKGVGSSFHPIRWLTSPKSRHLITPLVKDILAEGLTGSTCVLAKRNEEALQIAGLLMKSGRQAKLIK